MASSWLSEWLRDDEAELAAPSRVSTRWPPLAPKNESGWILLSMNEVSPENLLRSPPWRLRQTRKPPSSAASAAMPGTMYGGSSSEDRKLSSAGAGAGGAIAGRGA